jgi:hypothetical protein
MIEIFGYAAATAATWRSARASAWNLALGLPLRGGLG